MISPGGFVGGVTSDNVVTQRFSRSPALADAVRVLGLVDKQGIGVDRMFREVVTLGHRPPLLAEESGTRAGPAVWRPARHGSRPAPDFPDTADGPATRCSGRARGPHPPPSAIADGAPTADVDSHPQAGCASLVMRTSGVRFPEAAPRYLA